MAAGIMGKPVAEAFEAFKKAKEDAGRNAHYLQVDIGSRCGAFAKAFKIEVRVERQDQNRAEADHADSVPATPADLIGDLAKN